MTEFKPAEAMTPSAMLRDVAEGLRKQAQYAANEIAACNQKLGQIVNRREALLASARSYEAAAKALEAAAEPPRHPFMPDGPSLVRVDAVKVGTKLVCDDGFTCVSPGEIVTVEADVDGKLAFRCSNGLHGLDGQRANEDGQIDDDGEYYAGFWLYQLEAWHRGAEVTVTYPGDNYEADIFGQKWSKKQARRDQREQRRRSRKAAKGSLA
jgi:hypothetical protein